MQRRGGRMITDATAVIHRCLLSYARGIDRLDPDLIAAAFHPGAELLGYGQQEATTIEAFVERVIPSLRERYSATQHRLSNTWIDQRDDHWVVETYVRADHHVVGDDERLVTFNGRYIDRFVDQDGDIRIQHRQLLSDWTAVSPILDIMAADWTAGRRDASDPSYGS